jgi:MFS family permease
VTWSVIYFKRYMNIPSALDSIGFFTFMIFMASGRFSCDYIRKTIGRVKLVRISGFFAAIGILLLVLSPSLPFSVLFAVLGIASTGAGLSTLIPTMFSSAGHMPNTHAGTSIATVAAFTYCGSIVSPPMVGGVSQGLHSLRYPHVVVQCLPIFVYHASVYVYTHKYLT